MWYCITRSISCAATIKSMTVTVIKNKAIATKEHNSVGFDYSRTQASATFHHDDTVTWVQLHLQYYAFYYNRAALLPVDTLNARKSQPNMQGMVLTTDSRRFRSDAARLPFTKNCPERESPPLPLSKTQYAMANNLKEAHHQQTGIGEGPISGYNRSAP